MSPSIKDTFSIFNFLASHNLSIPSPETKVGDLLPPIILGAIKSLILSTKLYLNKLSFFQR